MPCVIQFNTLCINMWLSSLNIFEKNQFYEIKNSEKKVRMSKNEQ